MDPPLTLFDLPHDILDKIINRCPLLKSEDHANIARTCSTLWRVVRYSTISYAPVGSHNHTHRIIRLSTALRCAALCEKRNPGGSGIVVEVQSRNNKCSFTTVDVDIIACLIPEMFTLVKRIILLDITGGDCDDMMTSRLLKNLPPTCHIEAHNCKHCVMADIAANMGRLTIHHLRFADNPMHIARSIGSLRASAGKLHVRNMTIEMFDIDGLPPGDHEMQDVLEAVRTSGLSTDALIINPVYYCSPTSLARRVGAAIGRLARQTLVINHHYDFGTVQSVLMAPRFVNRIDLSFKTQISVVEMLGACLLDIGEGTPLETISIPGGIFTGEFMMRAIAQNRVREVRYLDPSDA